MAFDPIQCWDRQSIAITLQLDIHHEWNVWGHQQQLPVAAGQEEFEALVLWNRLHRGGIRLLHHWQRAQNVANVKHISSYETHSQVLIGL